MIAVTAAPALSQRNLVEALRPARHTRCGKVFSKERPLE
jgi:hypothetical protein